MFKWLHLHSLLTKLKDSTWNGSVIWEVKTIKEIGKIGDGRAVDLLLAALRVEKPPGVRGYEYIKMRLAVADALGEIGDARAIQGLVSELPNYSEVHDAIRS